jgi:hypothetical protein
MKNILLVSVAFIVAACGAVHAMDTTTVPVKIVKNEGIKLIKGFVVSADSLSGSVIVRSWRGQDTIMVDANTRIVNYREEPITLANFNADDRIAVYYKSREEKKIALEIIKKIPAQVMPALDQGTVNK